LDTFRQLGLGLWESYTLRILGALRRAERRLDMAEQFLEDAANLAQRYEDSWGEARARWILATVRMDQERPHEAVLLLRDAAAVAVRYEESWQEGEILADLARALRASGDRSAAVVVEADTRVARTLGPRRLAWWRSLSTRRPGRGMDGSGRI
jgi:hypothetical protein